MNKFAKRTMTRNGQPGAERVGVAFYYPGWNSPQRHHHAVMHEYPDGTIRRVWVDRDGRALMTAWFEPGTYWGTTTHPAVFMEGDL